MLIHTIDYCEYISEDRDHVKQFKSKQTIKNVRVDFNKRQNVNKVEQTNENAATVFCYAQHTRPFVGFKKNSKIEFDGDVMIIKDVIPIYEPKRNKLFGYELELV